MKLNMGRMAGGLCLSLLTGSAAAQPAMSRGEQALPLSYNDCMARARSAFEAYGWVNIGAGGAFTNAFRGGSGAYILCNEATPGRMIVNIIVATNGGDAGAERQQLQGAMADPKSIPRTPATPTASGCGWVNGNDPRGGNDYGRGILNADAHRNHVMANGAAVSPPIVASRFEVLRGCLSRDAYANLYADASVLVASYGRAIGWPDGQDPRVSTDPGRGVSSRQAHLNHALSTGAGNAPGLLRDRLAAINAAVPLSTAAQLYAEASLLLARYGGSR